VTLTVGFRIISILRLGVLSGLHRLPLPTLVLPPPSRNPKKPTVKKPTVKKPTVKNRHLKTTANRAPTQDVEHPLAREMLLPPDVNPLQLAK